MVGRPCAPIRRPPPRLRISPSPSPSSPSRWPTGSGTPTASSWSRCCGSSAGAARCWPARSRSSRWSAAAPDPVLGALADRFGPRRLILIGGVLLAALALGGQPGHARLAPLPDLRPAHRGRGGDRGLDARRGHGAAAVEGAPGPGPRHRGLRSRPRHLPGRPALPGADRRRRLALGVPHARHPVRALDPARDLPGHPRHAAVAPRARRARRGGPAARGRAFARAGAGESVLSTHRSCRLPRQHLQPDASRPPGRLPDRSRPARP